MTLAGLAPLVKPLLADQKSEWPEAIAVFGFFGGAAIATAKSFRSAVKIWSSSHLREHADPLKMWSTKMSVLAAVILGTGLMVCIAQIAAGNIQWREITVNAIEPVLLLAIIVPFLIAAY